MKRIMRVLIIAPNDLSVYDGTTIRITGLTKYSCSYLDEAYLASKTINNELKEISNLRWVKLRFFRALTLFATNYASILSMHGADSIITKVMSVKNGNTVDIIHAHWILSLPLALGLRTSTQTPIMIDLHGLFELTPCSFSSSFRDWLFITLSRVIERIRADDEHVRAFTVPSEALRAYITRRFGVRSDRIFVVPDGIDTHTIPDYSEKLVKSALDELNVHNRYLITYVGTPSYYHGFYDLLKAFKTARSALKNLLLLLIVPNRAYVQDIVRKMGLSDGNVVIFESIPRRRIYKYLYASSVLVLPHRAGTQFEYLTSNKLLDYMASGKPIVSYALKPVVHLMRDYPLKILVEPNNAHKLAEGILKAITLYKYECVNGKRYVREYDWDNIGKMLVHIYANVLEHM